MPRALPQPPSGASQGVVVYRRTGEVDAIDQHSVRLVAALCEGGLASVYASGGLSRAVVRAAGARWILLQYNPFSYGPCGFAPGIVREAVTLRYRDRVPLVVFVHEAWVATGGCRRTLMSGYQRAQLMTLLRAADAVIVTTEQLERLVGAGAVHVPVSSNVAPVSLDAGAARARLGIGAGPVVALFGSSHPTNAGDYADAAIDALAQRHGAERLTVLSLGATAPAPNVSQGVAVHSPGALDEATLSLHLRASDLLLLPFTDGVSTRRTTLMAGLAHGLSVVGMHDPRTDRVLLQHPEALVLTAGGDRAAFAAAAVALSEDDARRRATGRAARRLYEQAFDWPVAARRVAAVIRRL